MPRKNVAEGSLYAPILLLGSTGHKTRFATLGQRLATTFEIPHGLSKALKSYPGSVGQAGKQIGASIESIKNWEADRTRPLKQFWPAIRSILAKV